MLFRQNIQHKTLFRLSLASFVFAIAVVVLGAFTRLVDAGLGCPDWPGCYGHLLWPNDSAEIAKAEQLFPDAPVEPDKTWPEMVHRYFAGFLGLMILSLAILSWREQKNTANSVPLKHSFALLALVILQAAFGMWTVTLKLWPQVVTAHLLGGFATLSLLWLYTQRVAGIPWQSNTAIKAIKPLAIIALVAVILQIALGGWVSSNYAALACPDLPQCLGQWIPKADFKGGFDIFQDIGPNYLGGELDNHARTAIHFSHRVGALLVSALVILLGVGLWRSGDEQARKWALLLWAVLALQIGLGISNVWFSLPLAVAVAHNAVGALLLLTTLTITYKIAAMDTAALSQNQSNININTLSKNKSSTAYSG